LYTTPAAAETFITSSQRSSKTVGGNYKIAEGQLSFGPMMSTRMACPPDTLDAFFMRDLQRVASFFVEEGALYLELPYDSGTMRFDPAP